MRAETGLMRFGDDWSGTFIRGDNGFAIGLAIESVVTAIEKGETPHPFHIEELKQLSNLLLSAASDTEKQELKSFKECIKEGG